MHNRSQQLHQSCLQNPSLASALCASARGSLADVAAGWSMGGWFQAEVPLAGWQSAMILPKSRVPALGNTFRGAGCWAEQCSALQGLKVVALHLQSAQTPLGGRRAAWAVLPSELFTPVPAVVWFLHSNHCLDLPWKMLPSEAAAAGAEEGKAKGQWSTNPNPAKSSHSSSCPGPLLCLCSVVFAAHGGKNVSLGSKQGDLSSLLSQGKTKQQRQGNEILS